MKDQISNGVVWMREGGCFRRWNFHDQSVQTWYTGSKEPVVTSIIKNRPCFINEFEAHYVKYGYKPCAEPRLDEKLGLTSSD